MGKINELPKMYVAEGKKHAVIAKCYTITSLPLLVLLNIEVIGLDKSSTSEVNSVNVLLAQIAELSQHSPCNIVHNCTKGDGQSCFFMHVFLSYILSD